MRLDTFIATATMSTLTAAVVAVGFANTPDAPAAPAPEPVTAAVYVDVPEPDDAAGGIVAVHRVGGRDKCVGGPGQTIGVRVCVPSTYRRIAVDRIYEDGSALYVANSSGRAYSYDPNDRTFDRAPHWDGRL